MYYRRANAAVIVYDITSNKSFEEARSWVKGQYCVCVCVYVCVFMHVCIHACVRSRLHVYSASTIVLYTCVQFV